MLFFRSNNFQSFIFYIMFSVGIPGTECLFGGICSGGSICIDILCLCVDGEREFDGQCVDQSVYDSKVKESGMSLLVWKND